MPFKCGYYNSNQRPLKILRDFESASSAFYTTVALRLRRLVRSRVKPARIRIKVRCGFRVTIKRFSPAIIFSTGNGVPIMPAEIVSGFSNGIRLAISLIALKSASPVITLVFLALITMACASLIRFFSVEARRWQSGQP
jgi:hypothetical protein